MGLFNIRETRAIPIDKNDCIIQWLIVQVGQLDVLQLREGGAPSLALLAVPTWQKYPSMRFFFSIRKTPRTFENTIMPLPWILLSLGVSMLLLFPSIRTSSWSKFSCLCMRCPSSSIPRLNLISRLQYLLCSLSELIGYEKANSIRFHFLSWRAIISQRAVKIGLRSSSNMYCWCPK